MGDGARFDDIDRDLVLALQRDGRSSYASLASQVGMSQAAVRSRVQRLLDTGALSIAAVADPFAFGFTVTAMVGMTFTGDLEKLATEIGDIEQIHFVVITAGRYDCLAELVCVDQADLLALINDRIRSIPGVKDVEVITYLRMVKQWQPEFLRPSGDDS
jgi:Lrp/AsnC family transcriptional regulator for asnA, asnC and gidA